jgi:hypothetical protein
MHKKAIVLLFTLLAAAKLAAQEMDLFQNNPAYILQLMRRK